MLKGSFYNNRFGEVKYKLTVDNYSVVSNSQSVNLNFKYIDKILCFNRRKKSDKYEVYENVFSLEGISLKSNTMRIKRSKLMILEPTKSYILENIEEYFEYAFNSYKSWLQNQDNIKFSFTKNTITDIEGYNQHGLRNKVIDGYEFNKRARANNLHIK